MGFGHVQGVLKAGGSYSSSITVTLTNNPTTGNLVVVAWLGGSSPTSLTVKDANNNVYTVTPQSLTDTTVGYLALAYLLSAPSNANKAITISFTGTVFCAAWADEFSVSGGTAAFDLGATGHATNSGTTFNGVSITPSASGELLYALGSPNNALSNPTAGATQGVWTGSGGGPDTGQTDADTEYDLSSASGSTAVNFTDTVSGDTCSAIIGAWTITSAPTIAQTSGTFYSPESETVKQQALGFYYDDDTYGPNVAGWPGIGTIAAIPKTFEMDCDTTSRNLDLNSSVMQNPESDLPPWAWPGTGVIGTVVPPPLLWDLDCDTTSRNLDQFLAEMEVLDNIDCA
jgi:hypothetical protein